MACLVHIVPGLIHVLTQLSLLSLNTFSLGAKSSSSTFPAFQCGIQSCQLPLDGLALSPQALKLIFSAVPAYSQTPR